MLTAFVIWMGYIVSRLSGGLAFAGVLAFAIYTSETWTQGILLGLLLCLGVFVTGLFAALASAVILRAWRGFRRDDSSNNLS